eukprot:CAMPEP_0117657102 /NCGR_PEP_ID=MMETSP0804-20121206/5154_1 /TAXON_ID=1074897 /ORGANISM="Tetraselmis astigmatica, Strain CCMP880" /LENGTH=48 /DNA_ID= /DNA_START= /DNA_END= /DNA_ORIENTATION=
MELRGQRALVGTYHHNSNAMPELRSNTYIVDSPPQPPHARLRVELAPA